MVQNSIPATEDGANLHHNFSYGAFGVGGPAGGSGFTGRSGGLKEMRAGQLNWNRWLEVEDGRWKSRDSIGIDGGFNLYAYVRNHAATNIDWTGQNESPTPMPIEDVLPPELRDDAPRSAVIDRECAEKAKKLYATCKASLKVAQYACYGGCAVICAESTLGFIPCLAGCKTQCDKGLGAALRKMPCAVTAVVYYHGCLVDKLRCN